MAERRLHGLQRVLGVNALFSTAYGNVGSSIYYALGLVASFALGLTPVVFVITGFIFWLTASTYAEATAMYPEAGGSSSFARHAFNEFWSFFAAWAQMLNYTITIAISAFFVPHYLGGLFWEPLRSSPGDIIFGIGVVIVLSLVNVVGVKESAGVNVTLALVDFATQLLLVVVGAILVFSPEVLIDNVDFGVAPTWKDFFLAIPVGMIAYTGIETISNMAEEAKDETDDDSQGDQPRRHRRLRDLRGAAGRRAVGAAGHPEPQTGEYQTLLGLPEDEGGYAGDPILGVVKQIDLGALQHAAEIYVGLLAATILFIATNAGIIGVSRLVYSMGIHRQVPDGLRRLHPKYGTPWIGILIFGAIACLAMIPGQAEFLGNMYAFGAMLSFTIAHLAVIRLRFSKPDVPRPYRGPMNVRRGKVDVPVFAILGGLGTGLAFVVVTALHVDVADRGRRAGSAFGCIFYVLYRRRQGLDLTTTTQRRRAEAGRRAGGRVRLGPRRARPARLLAGRRRDRGPAGQATAPRDPRARPADRSQLLAARRRDARAGARGADDHRAGAPTGRAPRDGSLREGPRRAGGRLIVEEAKRAARDARSSCRCRRGRPARSSARRSRPSSRTARAA